tara:strand:- start:15 stop:284 length:270 start_codon:yes stop_codon:yes gene_type:complete
MIEVTIQISMTMLVISVFIALFRFFKGPTTADKVIAADTIVTNGKGIIALFAIYSGNKIFVIVVLTLTILSFVGTTLYAKFHDRGKIID